LGEIAVCSIKIYVVFYALMAIVNFVATLS
jgi:hypothetical protein